MAARLLRATCPRRHCAAPQRRHPAGGQGKGFLHAPVQTLRCDALHVSGGPCIRRLHPHTAACKGDAVPATLQEWVERYRADRDEATAELLTRLVKVRWAAWHTYSAGGCMPQRVALRAMDDTCRRHSCVIGYGQLGRGHSGGCGRWRGGRGGAEPGAAHNGGVYATSAACGGGPTLCVENGWAS